MIVIQVRLAAVALFSLLALLIAVSVTVLGLVLATHALHADQALLIPASLVAASAIVAIGVLAVHVCIPYVLYAGISVLGSSALLGGAGLYYLCQRVLYQRTLAQHSRGALEAAFIVLWAVLTSLECGIAAFVLGALHAAQQTDVEQGPTTTNNNTNDNMNTNPQSPLVEKPMETHTPLINSDQLQTPQLSPQLSWPSSIGSLQRSPQVTATPRSGLRIHLSRSSFSLRRSGSKASMARHQAEPLAAPPAQHPHPQLEPAVPELPEMADLRSSFILIPNESDSRSVSGSSRLTGRVFPAAEYNRKLNNAGFVKDEPVPVQLNKLRPYSQYDLEQMHMHRQRH